MKKAERKLLMRQYGGLYGRHFWDGEYKCFYCADEVGCLDHCPPISAFTFADAKYFRKQEIPLVTIPCCFECNSMLSDRKLFTALERLEYLELRYDKKFNTASALWSDEEIAEMGFSFRNTLRAKKEQRFEFARKVAAIQSRIAKDWTHPRFTQHSD